MRIVLIGLSGIGKSHWSRILSTQKGYTHICCDDLLERRLNKHLVSYGRGITAVADWMGHPYTEGYKQREQLYLKFEQEVLEEVLSDDSFWSGDNIILDTTGSVVHLDDAIKQQLSSFGTVVYLEVTASHQAEMYNLYLKEPKPLVWGECFQLQSGESSLKTLQCCYPELFQYRKKLYEQLAQISLGFDELRESNFGVEDFLSLIETRSV